jgi:hypothetical protein
VTNSAVATGTRPSDYANSSADVREAFSLIPFARDHRVTDAAAVSESMYSSRHVGFALT